MSNPPFNDSDTALRDGAFLQSETTSQVLSKAKNNMVALPGQLLYSTQIPVCLCFLAKKNVARKNDLSREASVQVLSKTRQLLLSGKLESADSVSFFTRRTPQNCSKCTWSPL